MAQNWYFCRKITIYCEYDNPIHESTSKESLDEHRFSLAVPTASSRIYRHGGHLPSANTEGCSMVCYKAGDWTKMVEASLDQDEDEAERLIGSGKCRAISTATKVNFIEGSKDGDKSALIQLPSGKTAMTASGWLR